jgi:hypothetical protein
MSSSDLNVIQMKEKLLKDLYTLQNDINLLWVNYNQNRVQIAMKEERIREVWKKFRNLQDLERHKSQN